MKTQKKIRCPLATPGRNEGCPLEPAAEELSRRSEPPSVLIVRTERKSWFTIAITGFGALLLRYLKTVRERCRTTKKR
jgi:hypothetical protein